MTSSSANTYSGTQASEPDGSSGAEFAAPQSFGRFQLRRELGRGGMGVVYLAFDPELERRVALKILNVSSIAMGGSGLARARLIREAQALAKLSHPNVVTVYDVGEQDSQIYLAMEYVEGTSLRDWLRDTRPTRDQVMDAMEQAGHGLIAAHAAGIVHRDFKPENVIVETGGRVIVLDFGLVQVEPRDGPVGEGQTRDDSPRAVTLATPPIGVRAGAGQLTMAGTIMGTPAYMAPEQTLGQSCGAAADQFGFCVTLYEAIHGRRPFSGRDSKQRLREILEWSPSRRRDVPSWLHDAMVRGLHADPGARYASLEELVEGLAQQRRFAQRRRSWIRFAGASSLAVAAMLMTLEIHQRADRELCQGAEQALLHVWDDERRTALATKFVATGLGFAHESANIVTASLDRYTGDWIESYVAICRATHIDETRSAADLDTGMVCLKGRLAALERVTTRFLDADETTVRTAARVAHTLPELEICQDLQRLRSELPVPESPRQRRKVEGLRAELIAVGATANPDGPEQAHADARRLLESAERIGYRPLQAEAHAWLGRSLRMLAQSNEAIEHFEQAVLLAQASGHRQLAAEAIVELGFTVDYLQGDHESGERWDRPAEAAVRAVGNPSDLLGTLLTIRGISRALRGRHAEAEQFFRRALKVRRAHYKGPSIAIVEALQNLSITSAKLAKVGLAVELMDDAIAMTEALFGASHPAVSMPYRNRGYLLALQGDYVGAHAAHARAASICQRAHNSESVACALYQSRALALAHQLGRFSEAGPTLRALEAGQEATGVRGHPDALWAESHRAALLLAMGRAEDALDPALEGLRALEAEPRVFALPLITAFCIVAEAELSLGRARQSLAHLTRARARMVTSAGPHERLAAVQLHRALGKTYLALGQPERALEEYRDALDLDIAVSSRQDTATAGPSLLGMSKALHSLGYLEDAEVMARDAYARHTRAVGQANHVLVPYLIVMGEISLSQHRWVEALEAFSNARELFDSDEVDSGWLVRIQFGSARAHWQRVESNPSLATGDARAHARSLARVALDECRRRGPCAESVERAIHSWLGSRR